MCLGIRHAFAQDRKPCDDFRSGSDTTKETERRDFHGIVAIGEQELGKATYDEGMRSPMEARRHEDLDVKQQFLR